MEISSVGPGLDPKSRLLWGDNSKLCFLNQVELVYVSTIGVVGQDLSQLITVPSHNPIISALDFASVALNSATVHFAYSIVKPDIFSL